MREQAVAAVGVLAVDRCQPDGLDPVEQRFTHGQLVRPRRSRAAHLLVYIFDVVGHVSETRMCLQPGAVRQGDRCGRDVINRYALPSTWRRPGEKAEQTAAVAWIVRFGKGDHEIGRASCRERVEISVGGG